MKTKKLSLRKFIELYDKHGSGLAIGKCGDSGVAYCNLDRISGQSHCGYACTRLLKYKTLKRWFERDNV